VRYFNDDDKQPAEAIAAVLRQQGVKDAQSRRITFLKARPGSIEVWLANDTQ
jgi:hypothetical protein